MTIPVRKMNPANEEMLGQISKLHGSTSMACQLISRGDLNSNEVAWIANNLRETLEILAQIIVGLDRMQLAK